MVEHASGTEVDGGDGGDGAVVADPDRVRAGWGKFARKNNFGATDADRDSKGTALGMQLLGFGKR